MFKLYFITRIRTHSFLFWYSIAFERIRLVMRTLFVKKVSIGRIQAMIYADVRDAKYLRFLVLSNISRVFGVRSELSSLSVFTLEQTV